MPAADRVSGKGALCPPPSGPRLESDSSPGSIFLVTEASEASCVFKNNLPVSKTTLNSHLEITSPNLFSYLFFKFKKLKVFFYCIGVLEYS